MGGVKNHFPESPVYRVYPLYIQADSVKRFLTPSLMLLSPCAVFVFNSAFVFVLTWLFLGCHPRQWPGARPSAPAYRAPSRPSPVTKGSTFWWGNSPLTRKVRLEEFLHLVQPLANSGPGVLWREGLPISTRREHLKGWSDFFLNGCKSGQWPLTHQPSRKSPHNQFFGVGIVILFFHEDHQRPKNSSCI